MKLKWGASTDVGMVRMQNEDSFMADDGLYIVADGMGGHNAGEVASALAVTTVRSGAKGGLTNGEQLRELVQQANSAIYTASLDDSTQSGMGTTLTAVAVVPGDVLRVAVANVGDSRTYLWRQGHLRAITVDHSYVQELVNEGIITPEEARTHPRRNIVTRALGIDRSVSVDVFTQELMNGDRLVLCSDGLIDEVADAEIARVLGQHSDAQEAAEALVMVANTNGGRDNTTVVVVDVLDDITDPVGRETTPDRTQPMEAIANPQPVKRRRFSIGVALFWSVLVAIVLSAVTMMGVYARSGYFVGFDKSNNVVVYRGKPGGVLWFNPTIDTQTKLTSRDLPEDILRDVSVNRSFGSSQSARTYLRLVEKVIVDAATSTTVTSTTVGK
jgi:protein phosphatase